MANNGSLKLGWAEVSITPEGRRIMLEGQFYDRISQYVETPITATALAIESDGEQAVIISADLTHVTADLVAMVRAELKDKAPGFDPMKLIVGATHTHTSFVYQTSNDLNLHALEDYLGIPEEPVFGNGNVETDNLMEPLEAGRFLAGRLSDAAAQAWKNRAPARFAPAFGRAAVGMNRRVCYFDGTAKMWGDTYTSEFKKLEGGNDNGVEMIFVYDKSMKPTGAVINIACPAQVVEQRYFISSDYWGKVRILLRRRFGEDFKVLGICSPAGDQCPRDLVRWVEPETPIEDPNVIRNDPPARRADPSMFDVKGTWKIGRRITDEVTAIFEEDAAGREYFDSVPFKHEVIQMPLPLRRVTEEENRAARAALDAFAVECRGRKINFRDSAAMHESAGIAARYDHQKTTDTFMTEIHVIRLGDIAIATNPFELFLDFANIIRARSAAKQTFLIQLANGASGYLPTEEAEKGGHYSAYVSSGWVGHEGGYKLAENILDEIGKLFAE
ncbi:MAG: hypothetical protein II534_07350 [Clostridia bacterium]|nr:hypothetical protein [Clostridia bacterium]